MPDGQIETPEKTADKTVTISDSAVRRLKVLAGEPEHAGLMFRVAVGGGGCSGFQYSFTFDDQANDDDHVIEKDGVSVLIDEMSWDFLAGSVVDFKEELIGAYFTVENPNAASTCGCGTSFAI
jgi:iron-sulfur cluster insertion protein